MRSRLFLNGLLALALAVAPLQGTVALTVDAGASAGEYSHPDRCHPEGGGDSDTATVQDDCCNADCKDTSCAIPCSPISPVFFLHVVGLLTSTDSGRALTPPPVVKLTSLCVAPLLHPPPVSR